MPDLSLKDLAHQKPPAAPSTAPVLLTSGGDWNQMAEEEKRWSLASLELSLKDLSGGGGLGEDDDTGAKNSEKLKNMLDRLDRLIVDEDRQEQMDWHDD